MARESISTDDDRPPRAAAVAGGHPASADGGAEVAAAWIHQVQRARDEALRILRRRGASDDLRCKADLCASALTEAQGLATGGTFGAHFSRLVARAGELLDDIDEVLIGLHPGRDHSAFARVAVLHRELERVQSLTPREYRCSQRCSPACAIAPPVVTGAPLPASWLPDVERHQHVITCAQTDAFDVPACRPATSAMPNEFSLTRAMSHARPVAIVLGCGELGSAVAWAMDDAGLAVVLVDEADPAWHRRGMAFTNAWYIGNAELDGKGACFCASLKSIPSVLARGMIAATTWSWPGIAGALGALALVDTRRRNRRGTEVLRGRVPITIGVGPGFVADESVDLAIEGCTDDPSEPGAEAAGFDRSGADNDLDPCNSTRHVLSSTRRGRFATGLRIGESVRAGWVVGGVGSDAICAPASGILLGLTAHGARVEPGDELVEIHTDRVARECFGMGTGSRHVAATVLAALADRLNSVRDTKVAAESSAVRRSLGGMRRAASSP